MNCFLAGLKSLTLILSQFHPKGMMNGWAGALNSSMAQKRLHRHLLLCPNSHRRDVPKALLLQCSGLQANMETQKEGRSEQGVSE